MPAALPRLLLLLDCETTGLDSRSAELCEVGAVLFSVPHRAVPRQLSFLRPVVSNPVQAINGIDPAITLEEQPQLRASELFVAIFKAADAGVAHNAAFDRPWICTCEGITWEGLSPVPPVPPWLSRTASLCWPRTGPSPTASMWRQILQRDPQLEEHLAEGLLPRRLVAADLPFARKGEAKDAGFRWMPEEKRWQRRCTDEQIEALPFPVIPLEVPA
jgi:DNA polymerase-3 subunit epsilon